MCLTYNGLQSLMFKTITKYIKSCCILVYFALLNYRLGVLNEYSFIISRCLHLILRLIFLLYTVFELAIEALS